MGQKKLGALLLLCTPLIDVVLLVVTVIDLRRGTEASIVHGLAAIYIGVSIVYGHSMIKWADVRFAYRFADGPSPEKKVRYGREHAHRERIGWFKHLLAWAIGCSILYGMILLVNMESRTEGLSELVQIWSIVLGVDFVHSFSYTFWPRRQKDAS